MLSVYKVKRQASSTVAANQSFCFFKTTANMSNILNYGAAVNLFHLLHLPEIKPTSQNQTCLVDEWILHSQLHVTTWRWSGQDDIFKRPLPRMPLPSTQLHHFDLHLCGWRQREEDSEVAGNDKDASEDLTLWLSGCDWKCAPSTHPSRRQIVGRAEKEERGCE